MLPQAAPTFFRQLSSHNFPVSLFTPARAQKPAIPPLFPDIRSNKPACAAPAAVPPLPWNPPRRFAIRTSSSAQNCCEQNSPASSSYSSTGILSVFIIHSDMWSVFCPLYSPARIAYNPQWIKSPYLASLYHCCPVSGILSIFFIASPFIRPPADCPYIFKILPGRRAVNPVSGNLRYDSSLSGFPFCKSSACISARRFRGVPPHLQVRPRPRLDGSLQHAAGMRA